MFSIFNTKDLFINILFIVFAVFQSLIFVDFTSKVSRMKMTKEGYKIIGVVLLILFNCFSFTYLYRFGYWIPNILFVISCMVYLRALSITYWIENIILSLIYYITFWVITYVVACLFNMSSLSGIFADYISTIVALDLVYVVISNMMPEFIDYKDHEITNRQFGFLLFFSVIGFICLMLCKNEFLILLGVICDIIIFLLSINISAVESEKRRKRISEERVKMLEEQDEVIKAAKAERYKSYKKSQEINKKMKGALDDLINKLNYLLACPTIDSIKENVIKMLDQLDDVPKYYDTGSSIVDIVLQDEREKAIKDGIKFGVAGGFGEYGLKVVPEKACMIFGSLLDNAIEGASKVEDGLKRVDIYFYQKPHEEFYLEVKNKKNKKEKLKIVDGRIETSKENKMLYGMGLDNVRRTVKSCGGRMRVTNGEDDFTVEIWIPEKE